MLGAMKLTAGGGGLHDDYYAARFAVKARGHVEFGLLQVCPALAPIRLDHSPCFDGWQTT
jgi:hypothetical protein